MSKVLYAYVLVEKAREPVFFFFLESSASLKLLVYVGLLLLVHEALSY
jgi:hypothetical protein